MEPIRRLRRLFSFDAWASRESLDSLSSLPPPPGPATAPPVRLLGHIGATQVHWLARIRAEPPSIAVWPELDLASVTRVLTDAAAAWRSYLARVDAGELVRPVTYTNSQGERWTSLVSDIAEHVLLHGHYHRGQIAAQVRAAGGKPAYIDFIHAVRSNFLPPEETVHD